MKSALSYYCLGPDDSALTIAPEPCKRANRLAAGRSACSADRKTFPLRCGFWLLGDYISTPVISIIFLSTHAHTRREEPR